MMEKQEVIHMMTIKFLEGVGDVNGRKLIEFFGSAAEVLRQSNRTLRKVPGTGKKLLSKSHIGKARALADQELEYVERNHIGVTCYGDPDYPEMLRHCHDAPLVLFKKGNFSWDNRRILSVVGTRKMTRQGLDFIFKFMREAKLYDPVIVSGMAYGVDICAHKRALAEGLSTIGVLAHGLDRLYPALHRDTAERVMENGGLLTEFPSGTWPEKKNFVRRNRIIAGLSEATLVVESGSKGGSLITADLALSYHREVFAVPGRSGDVFSKGCNQLIRDNKAGLITCFADLERALNWTKDKMATVQKRLFNDLDPLEQKLYDLLQKQSEIDLDLISFRTDLSVHETASILLQLEIKGLVARMPGNSLKAL